MNYRSSFTLLRHLQDTRELTNVPGVRHHVDKAVAFIAGGGSGRKYGSGPSLVRHLNDAAQAAVLHQEWELAQRLQRFAAYASGEMPLAVLDMYYDPEAKERQERYMRHLAGLGSRQAVASLDVLISACPDATAADARDFFLGVARAAEHVVIGSGDGGVALSSRDADRLLWLGKMELAVKNLPRSASPEAADFLDDLISAPDAGLLAQLVELRARRASLAALRAAVNSPDSSESDLHACLKNQEWIFGGAYTGELVRRRYTADAILDIPLLRGDGSLHVVELKKARVPSLVVRPGGHLMLGAQLHRAVSQAQNYLRSLDENRSAILHEHGIDCRRASATVVIGHPRYLRGDFSAQEVADTIRTYNSHHARIHVITYQMLLESAERMLALTVGSEDGQPRTTEENE
ncbi:Shedu anti-phage system protein SduA domain-containing protein [Streptomyces sp. URMC 129]|uniref:Shedu anti-phage system protein SduA domain-containing protein n=1 Tax=Streptomyces sp. URMC 129 TaxID=3423407 RepID=UPI003F1DCC7C